MVGFFAVTGCRSGSRLWLLPHCGVSRATNSDRGSPRETRDGLELSDLPAVQPGELSMDGAKAIMEGWFEDTAVGKPCLVSKIEKR